MPHSLHSTDNSDSVHMDQWRWMNHDLALARAAAANNNRSRALMLVATVDNAMRVQIDDMLAKRGTVSVSKLHAALSQIARKSGGWPLKPLPVELTDGIANDAS